MPHFVLRRLAGARRRALHFFKEHTLFTSAVLIAGVLSTTALVFQYWEPEGRDAIWRSAVYLFSGIDVEPPQTPIGQFSAIVVLVCGLLLISLVTGYVASVFSQVLLTSHSVPYKTRLHPLRDHVVIFGWGPKTKAILRELNADYEARGYQAEDFVVVSDKQALDKGDMTIYRNVWHARGSRLDGDALKRADLAPVRGRGAKLAAILGDYSLSDAEADRQSLLTLLAVEHLNGDIISLAEVAEEENAEHFSNAYADHVLLPKKYGRMLLARSSEHPGSATFIDELLSLAPAEGREAVNPEASPVSAYVLTAAELGVSGKPVPEAVSDYYGRKGGLISGILTAEGVNLIPDIQAGDEQVLSPSDRLIVITRPENI